MHFAFLVFRKRLWKIEEEGKGKKKNTPLQAKLADWGEVFLSLGQLRDRRASHNAKQQQQFPPGWGQLY